MPHANITTDILSIEEARRRIPLVKPHVVSLMEITSELIDLSNTLEDLSQRPGDHTAAREQLTRRSEALMRQYGERLRAVNDLGATLKDPSTGLLDFYAWKDDDLVFLCWRYGEDTVRHWHRLADGFSGRRPIED